MRSAVLLSDCHLSVRRVLWTAFFCCTTVSSLAAEEGGIGGQPPVEKEALGNIPVREVTVFKDGHAFVLHEGDLPVDEHGTAYLDHLPSPVIGTFWPYAVGDGVTLQSVVAGSRTVQFQEQALGIRDLLRANLGAKVHLKLAQERFAGTIVSIPSRGHDIRIRPCLPRMRQPSLRSAT